MTSSIEKKIQNLRTDLEYASCTTIGKFVAGWWFYPTKILVATPALKAAEIVLPPVPSVVPFSELVVGAGLDVSAITAHLAYKVGADVGIFIPDKEKQADFDSTMKTILGFSYSLGLSLLSASFRLPKLKSWFHSLVNFFGYLIESGIASEMEKEAPDAAVNLLVLNKIQQRTRSFKSNGTVQTCDLEEGKYFMKYATAAYGIPFMAAAEDQVDAARAAQEKRNTTTGEAIVDEDEENEYIKCTEKASASKTNAMDQSDSDEVDTLFKESEEPSDEFRDNMYKIDTLTEKLTLKKISSHVGVESSQIEYMFVKSGGSVRCLRHFIAVDHNKKAVVISIRGTYSISGIFTDIQVYTKKFCGGESHAGIANETNNIWKYAGPKVKLLLNKYPTYDLIITGHSLGAGCACLLTLKCYHDGIVGDRNVRCYAFASPKVYTLLDDAPEKCKEAIANTINYIHDDDCVSFLSGYNVRKLLQSLRAVREAERSLFHRIRLITDRKELTQELIDAVERAVAEPLSVIEGAPQLYIPAEKIIWMRGSTDAGYKAYLYKPEDLPEGIHVDGDMINDHFCSFYEEAFATLTNDL